MLALLLRRAAAGLGLGTCAQPGLAQAQFLVRDTAIERLRVGIRRDELDAHHAFTNHVVNGVAAGATDTDHLDDRAPFASCIFFLDDFKHGSLLRKKLLNGN